MSFKIIRKDFIPTYITDDNGIERRFNYSYTGREFESITGYLMSNGVSQYWATEEDVLELKADLNLSLIEDHTQINSTKIRERIIQIYHAMIEYESKETVVKKIINHTQDEFISEYMKNNDYIPF